MYKNQIKRIKKNFNHNILKYHKKINHFFKKK